ncbi:MAG TPA: flap structure-specific endonuclease, partial [Candidatus Micrarchaeota archaeon]|nr:flap structure-specific endonuclease [Candidatus Micrarchaeota archaeon]
MGVSISELVKPRETSFSEFSGKIVAIDAYNTLYQFLTSIRQPDGTPLSDSNGNPTGHLTGLFYRTTKLLEAGVKPVFVFDGVPPEFKRATLEKRHDVKVLAHADMEAALKAGDFDAARKFSARTVRLTREMALEAQGLLKAMGVPSVNAPSEGEACASVMVREGIAYAVASQDYDALLFGAPRLIRNMSVS